MRLEVKERFLPRPKIDVGTLPIPSLMQAREMIIDEHKAKIGNNPSRFIAYASGGKDGYLFVSTIFGRDGGQMALDCVEKSNNLFDQLRKTQRRLTPSEATSLRESAEHFRAVAHDTCLILAQLQGTKLDRVTGEEPGKIIHEHRNSALVEKVLHEGKITPEQQQRQLEILNIMSALYGGQETTIIDKNGRENKEKEVTVWFSNDSTPLFLKLVHSYMQTLDAKGKEAFLQETYNNKEDQPRTMREAIEGATNWIVQTIEKGPLLYDYSTEQNANRPHLLSWQHTNRYHQQLLEDSQEAWFDEKNNGLTNEYAPRMATQIQGVVYDALKHGAILFQRPELMVIAKQVQDDVVEKLWMPDVKYFAQGLDVDPVTGKYRQVKTLTQSASELLDSDILKDLPRQKSLPFIKGIVHMLYSDEFLTPFGPLTQAKRHMDFFRVNGEQFSPYHNATTWLVLTGRLIKGLEHHGLFGLASDMRTRLINAASVAGSFVEFLHVTKDGVIGNGHIDAKHPADKPLPWGKQAYDSNGNPIYINSTNYQEALQGWSYMAVEREIDKVNQRRFFPTLPLSWKNQLENDVQGNFRNRALRRLIPAKHSVQLLRSAEEVENARQNMPVARIHVPKGKELQKVLFNTLGVKETFELNQDGVRESKITEW